MELEFDSRGARVDEAIDICRALWSEEFVEHHGVFFDFAPVVFNPKPTQRRIPNSHWWRQRSSAQALIAAWRRMDRNAADRRGIRHIDKMAPTSVRRRRSQLSGPGKNGVGSTSRRRGHRALEGGWGKSDHHRSLGQVDRSRGVASRLRPSASRIAMIDGIAWARVC